jgi:hypothetical protein
MLEVRLSESAVRLFAIEVTFDQTLHPINPIHRTETSLIAMQLLDAVSPCVVSLHWWVEQTALCRVGQGALAMSFGNQEGGGPKHFPNHCSIRRHYATSRKVAGSRPDEVNEFSQFT